MRTAEVIGLSRNFFTVLQAYTGSILVKLAMRASDADGTRPGEAT